MEYSTWAPQSIQIAQGKLKDVLGETSAHSAIKIVYYVATFCPLRFIDRTWCYLVIVIIVIYRRNPLD